MGADRAGPVSRAVLRTSPMLVQQTGSRAIFGGVITSTHIFPSAGAARLGQLVLRYTF